MSDLDLRMQHRSHRSPSGRTARGCLAVAVALAIVVGTVGVVVWRGAGMVSGLFAGPEDYSGQGSGSVRVEVREGDSATDIGSALESAGVVASVEAFTNVASADPRSVSIQPGLYRLQEQMSAQAALSLLVGGEAVIDTSVTIPEGFTVAETVQRLVDEGGFSLGEVVRATRQPTQLGLPAWADGDLEGFLYPSTYPVDRRATPADLLAQMLAQFSRESTKLSLVDGAEAVGVTPHELVIIASLVQAEASRPQDFGKVARTIYNRLDDGMRLQLDSTRYLDAADTQGDPVRYDTYRYEGLPPGAINSPGELALKAALEPPPGDWMYFVTINLETGQTLFADGFAEHQRNVVRYRAYCDDSDLC